MSSEAKSGGGEDVCAVIVTFHPEFPLLEKLLESLLPQVGGVVMVDNTPGEEPGLWFQRWRERAGPGRAELIPNGENLGVGAAQNQGIAWARTQGFGHVLLMDHDSVPAAGMVAGLLEAERELLSGGARVSAVGPRVVSSHTGLDMYFVRFGWLRFKKIWCDPKVGGATIPADFLLSSGSLIRMKVLGDVGVLDEGLFIDHVDTEWYLRARARGYGAFGVCRGTLRHKLSDGNTKVWFGYWRQFPRHPPIRLYYTYRNSLVLFRRPYAPLKWIVDDVIRLVKICVYYCLLVPPRLEHARMIWLGCRDGLSGKQGRLDL